MYEKMMEEASAAAQKAFVEASPVPMRVVQRANPLDNNSPIVYSEVVDDGACGFAWVRVSDARNPFVRWLKKNGIGYKPYGKGWELSSRVFCPDDRTQSITRKYAACSAAAKVMRSYGIDCSAWDRLD